MEFQFAEQLAGKTDTELIDILSNPEEYQERYVLGAEAELRKRGVNYAPLKKSMEDKRQAEIEKLKKGIPGNFFYMTAALAFAILGGFIGIIAGFHFCYAKKNGYYIYDKNTREKGGMIAVLGILVMILATILALKD